MSDDTAPSRTPRSSVLYALGRLAESNENLKGQIEGLPQRVAEMFNPRLLVLEASRLDHDKRILFLERRFWMLAGGTAVVVFVIETVPHILPR